LGTGYLPKGEEAQTYKIEGTDQGLTATAEVTSANGHQPVTSSGKSRKKTAKSMVVIPIVLEWKMELTGNIPKGFIYPSI